MNKWAQWFINKDLRIVLYAILALTTPLYMLGHLRSFILNVLIDMRSDFYRIACQEKEIDVEPKKESMTSSKRTSKQRSEPT